MRPALLDFQTRGLARGLMFSWVFEHLFPVRTTADIEIGRVPRFILKDARGLYVGLMHRIHGKDNNLPANIKA